jgi:ribosome biogenesis GTPase A
LQLILAEFSGNSKKSSSQGCISSPLNKAGQMTSNPLKPNVQDLQTDVIELLGQISTLMYRASTALSSDRDSKKYAAFKKEVDDANRNVDKLELRMAIVAPMKAGKSTIVNAIVGQDILPSRNAAMTTLPTEIVFNAELLEPALRLSPEILVVMHSNGKL